ncbi:villin [Tieghemostelium lacteum]|uniref:Villin n=1 Tax=Tieghemostelium lacteum TaxID=361077 RepID=A0A151ZG76_TIELA|nr:villin [Tieghemostelium lacteum]|eukprot:KYQ92976.1 villin [Tieghemostelium lacteum]
MSGKSIQAPTSKKSALNAKSPDTSKPGIKKPATISSQLKPKSNSNTTVKETSLTTTEVVVEPTVTTTTFTVSTDNSEDQVTKVDKDKVEQKDEIAVVPNTTTTITTATTSTSSPSSVKKPTTTTSSIKKPATAIVKKPSGTTAVSKSTKSTTSTTTTLKTTTTTTTKSTSSTNTKSIVTDKPTISKIVAKPTSISVTTSKLPAKTATPKTTTSTAATKITKPPSTSTTTTSTSIKAPVKTTSTSTSTSTATKATVKTATTPAKVLTKTTTTTTPTSIGSKVPAKTAPAIKTPSKAVSTTASKATTTTSTSTATSIKTPAKTTSASASVLKVPAKTTSTIAKTPAKTTSTTAKTPAKAATTTSIKTPAKTTVTSASALKAPAKTTATTTKTPTKSSNVAVKSPVKSTSTAITKTPSKITSTPTKTASKVTTTPQQTKSTLGAAMGTTIQSPTLKNISKPIGPAGRKKPSANPIKAMQNSNSKTTTDNSKSRTNISSVVTGFGLLASVGVKGNQSSEDILQEFKNMKLNSTNTQVDLRLIQCTGRKNIIPRLVELSSQSFRCNNCYVLDTLSVIYEWRGSKSNKMQIAKAMDLAGRIKNKERSGRPQIKVIEEGKKSPGEDEFWSLIPGGKPSGQIPESDSEKPIKHKDLLYQLNFLEESSEISAEKAVSPDPNGKMVKEILLEQNQFTYILDSWTEVYVWVGKQSNQNVKKHCMSFTKEFMKKRKGRAAWVEPMKISEGTETELFKEKFFNWNSTLPISMGAIAKGRVAEVKKEEFKAQTIIDQWSLPAPVYFSRVIDDGNGSVQIWRVKDHTKEPVPNELYGHFYDGESYVILYKYQQKNKDHYVIYFWQGKKSTINEKGSSALLTVDLDDSIGGVAQQIRVVQNKEPVHFMKIFKGSITIHQGLMDNDKTLLKQAPYKKMYHIKSCNHFNNSDNVNLRILVTRDFYIGNLNSNDYILVEEFTVKDTVREELIVKPKPAKQVIDVDNDEINIDGDQENKKEEEEDQQEEYEIVKTTIQEEVFNIYLWKGNYSSNILDIEEIVDKTIERMYNGIDIIKVLEDQEPLEFINLFKEKDEEEVTDSFISFKLEQTPKLYQCSYSSGTFKVDRVFEFDQQDLDDEDVMILDVGSMIFLWIGRNATQDEKLQSMNTVLEYTQLVAKKTNMVDGSEDNFQVLLNCYLIQSSLEPKVFRRYFHCWNDQKTQIHNPACEEMVLVKDYLSELNRQYTLDELQHPPRALDKTKLERYLSDDDFFQHFKMTKSEFDNQKVWKQEQMKKQLGIY